jgi:hypothetical protein
MLSEWQGPAMTPFRVPTTIDMKIFFRYLMLPIILGLLIGCESAPYYPRRNLCNDFFIEHYHYAKEYKAFYMSRDYCAYSSERETEQAALLAAKKRCIENSDPEHTCVLVAIGRKIYGAYTDLTYPDDVPSQKALQQNYGNGTYVCNTTVKDGCKQAFPAK